MEKTEMVKLPGWETVRIIGSGSSGTVYELRKKDEYGGDFHTALKVVSIPSSNKEYEEMQSTMTEYVMRAKLRDMVEEISGEYRLMGVLRGHPNIVNCEDQMIIPHTDDMGWDIYIRMELLTSLPDHVHEHGITGSEVMKLGVDICTALEVCAANGIIHRDIKPQNIFVSRYGDFKLGDFGVAKAASMGSVDKVGTYSYMAPEVYKGKVYNGSVDIYSLGMVLYWLLNERRGPFLPLGQTQPTDEQVADAYLRRYRGEPVPAPKNGNAAMKQVVMRACAYNPEQRFASPTEMKNAIIMAMQGKILQSTPTAEDEPTVREVGPALPSGHRVSAQPVKAPASRPVLPQDKPTFPPVSKPAPQTVRREPVRRPESKPEPEEKNSSSVLLVLLALLLTAVLLFGVYYFFGDSLFGDKDAEPTRPPVESAEPTYKVSSVILSSPSIALKEGMEDKLDVSFIPDLPRDTELKLVWKSSNSGIASVDNEGNITGVSAGTATIRVYVESQVEVFDECTVTVEKPKITSFTIEQRPDKTRYSVGEELDLTGLIVRVSYDNDREKRITDPQELKVEADLNGLGNRTVKLIYEDATCEFTVWVGLF
ncbi:MAG: protein kinase [Oscillospiraceae bacterium]|nr:protein kinase [Oscillospiraceae bacterium]